MCDACFEKMRFLWKKNRRFFFKESLRTRLKKDSKSKGLFVPSKSGRERQRQRERESKVHQQKQTKKKKKKDS